MVACQHFVSEIMIDFKIFTEFLIVTESFTEMKKYSNLSVYF